jgi:hypothetical protein
MSDREKDVGRLAAREQEKSENDDSESQENQGSKESQEDKESAQDTTQSTDDGANPSSDADAAESGSERRAVNVKDRGATLFAYLPKSLDNDVDLACQSVNLTYQRESGEKLGKNRYLYPIIMMVGADNAVDLSYEEIHDLVERVDEVEDAA